MAILGEAHIGFGCDADEGSPRVRTGLDDPGTHGPEKTSVREVPAAACSKRVVPLSRSPTSPVLPSTRSGTAGPFLLRRARLALRGHARPIKQPVVAVLDDQSAAADFRAFKFTPLEQDVDLRSANA